jgi:hypothetical protein
VIEILLLLKKLGGQIFGHQVWQPKSTENFGLPRMAIQSDQKLVIDFFKHYPK